jgi:hypothetical protein
MVKSESDTDSDSTSSKRPVREKRVPARYSDSEFKKKVHKQKSEKTNRASATTQAPTAPVTTTISVAPTTDSAMIPRPSMQYVPSPQERPLFRGHVLEGEPPKAPGTPEVDVKVWLDLLEAHFKSTGLSDDEGRIMQLMQRTHKRLGDARGAVHLYLSTDHVGFTYAEAKEDLQKAYSSVVS